MRLLVICTVLSLALLMPNRAFAETYRGIGAYYTLNDVMAIFPGAQFEEIEAAWTKRFERLYKVTGVGIEGTIVLKFDHMPTFYEDLSESAQSDGAREWFKELSESYDGKSENQRLEVQWVRWVPDYIFPVSRLVSKYGSPSKKGFSDKSFEPYWEWQKKEVYASLDDNQNVTAIEFNFTEDEKNQYFARSMGVSLEEYKKLINRQAPVKSKKK